MTRRSLSWEAGAEVADLVEEEGAVPGLVDEALEVGVGPRIGALAVAEEEVGEEGVVEAGRVDGDELALSARELVDRAREELLADAGLARYEDGMGAPRDGLGVGHELEHAGVGGRYAREGGVALGRGREEPLLDRLVLAKELLVLDERAGPWRRGARARRA